MSGAAAGAAGAAAIAQAIKAFGAIIRVEPGQFEAILSRSTDPLVVSAQGGLFRTVYLYLTAYKGLIFFTKSPVPLSLPGGVELITAKSIWAPG